MALILATHSAYQYWIDFLHLSVFFPLVMLISKIYLGFTYDVTRKAYKTSYIEDLWATICFACYTGSYLFW